jgi:hypothetical protein
MKQVTCIIRSDVADSWPMTGYSSPIRVMEGLPTTRPEYRIAAGEKAKYRTLW